MGHAGRQTGHRAGCRAEGGRWPGRIGLAVLLLVSGCAAVEDMFKPAPPPKPAAVARPSARPAARPVRPPATVPAPEPVQSAALPAPADVPAPDLKGAPAARVEEVLGAPSARQPSGAGERWSWRAQGCTLDLFLFPDVATGGLAVLDQRGEGAPAGECARLVAGARGR